MPVFTTVMERSTAGLPDGAENGHVAILDVDPDLRATVPESEVEVARRHLRAPAVSAEPGILDGELMEKGSLGALVVEGLLTRDLVVAQTSSRELLGAGDLIRPWDTEPEFGPVSETVSFTILEPTRFAVLDRRFLKLAGRWPALGDEIIHRVLRRSRWLALRLAIGNLRGIPDQIMLLLWHLSSNWGRITPEGTLLPLDLTHELIADLIGARRPSVTTAITELRETGRLERLGEGWLLTDQPPAG